MSDFKIRAKSDLPNEARFALLQAQTRRHFLRSMTAGVGSMFLGSLASQFAPGVKAAERGVDGTPRLDFTRDPSSPLSVLPPQFAPRAKRIIYLHMAGAPSQLELFEHKPDLNKLDGQECPASFLVGKRFAFISGVPKLLGAQYPFHQAGKSGQWMSDRLPHLEKHIDDLCLIRSMRTDQFNHAPAQLLVQTGNARLGYPSMGSWVLYGLGTENQNLPGFIVLVSGGNQPDGGKQLWGSGFLPSVYQGVQCRSHGEPVLYLENPSRRKPSAAPQHAGRSGRNQPAKLCRVRKPRNRYPHRPIRDGVSHANGCHGRYGYSQGACRGACGLRCEA